MREQKTGVRLGDPDVGVSLGYHKVTSREMADAIRKRIEARPRVKFSGLDVGRTYLYDSDDVLTVVRTTPSGRQVTVRDLRRFCAGEPAEARLYAGSYPNYFFDLDGTLIALCGVSHEDVVREAVARGLDVPAQVRCEHPGMFLDIPERFAVNTGEFNAETAAGRVKTALVTDWGHAWPRRPVSAEAVDKWIDEAHRRLASFRSEAVRRVALNRDTQEDYDRVEREFHELVDFYRWLRPHVSPSGVFHVPDPV